MNKTIIAILLTAAISGVSAHSNQCDYSVDYNIDINEERLLFDKKNGDKVVFEGDRLTINNLPVALSSEQMQASRDFQREARAMIPKIANIAVDGAEIGVKAATIALTTLFGESEEVHEDLIAPIEAISEKIKTNINETSLNTQELKASFDEGLDAEIEKLVETAVTKYSGRIVGQVIGSIFSGDNEEMEDFEFRMENMEHDIERYVEKQAEDLEARADELCDDLKSIALLDEKLESISNYPENGIIQQDANHGFKISGLNINRD